MPPGSLFAKYKQNIRNYLFYKCGWDKIDAVKWLNENIAFVRQMFAAGATYKETARVITEMEQKVNVE